MTPGGASSFLVGEFGAQFTTSGDAFTAGGSFSTTLPAFTLEFWVQLVGTFTNSFDGWLSVVLKNPSGITTMATSISEGNTATEIEWFTATGALPHVDNYVTLAHMECWNHYVITWDSGGNVNSYINGALIDGRTGMGAPSISLDHMIWGDDSLYSKVQNVAHLALYNYALTGGQVLANYNAATPRQDAACFGLTPTQDITASLTPTAAVQTLHIIGRPCTGSGQQHFAQWDHDPEAFVLLGAAASTSVATVRDLTVYYENGSSDTILAGTVAVLPDDSTTFDRSTAVYVIYTLISSGRLYASAESQLASLLCDYAPLLRVLRHGLQEYQPMQPSGAAIKAGAWSGGAYISAGRSISGGASAVGPHLMWSANTPDLGGTVAGFFFKIAALPASDMTLLDVDAGSGTYMRVKLTSAGAVVQESRLDGVSSSITLNPSLTVTTGTWYWASASVGRYINGILGDDHNYLFGGVLYRYSDSATDGQQVGEVPSSSFYTTLVSTLGWGVSSSSGYLNFPNTAGNEMSKLDYFYAITWSTVGPPSSDVSASGKEALYLCNQPVGTTSGVLDSTTNHYDLSPGPQGVVIIGDGPYV